MSEKVRIQLLLKAANWDLSVNCLLYCYCPLLNPVIAALPLNVTSSIVKFKVHFHFLNVYNIVKVKINSHFYHHFVFIFSLIFPEKNENIFLFIARSAVLVYHCNRRTVTPWAYYRAFRVQVTMKCSRWYLRFLSEFF